MKPLQFYKTLSIVLLALNIAMIAFFIWRKPPPPRGNRGGKSFLHQAQRILKMDEQQNAQFIKMALLHKSQMDSIHELQSQLLIPSFETGMNSSIDSTTNPSLEQLGQLEQQKVQVTYRHFQEIKSILKPEQMADFESFMDIALKNILLKMKKNPPRPKDF